MSTLAFARPDARARADGDVANASSRRHSRARVAMPVEDVPEVALTGRVVGRRLVSARLAFYDVACDASALERARETARGASGTVTEDETRAGVARAMSVSARATEEDVVVEVVLKLGVGSFESEDAVKTARRDAFRLGNVLTVRGTLAREDGARARSQAAWSLRCESVEEVVERWEESNPGRCFARHLYVKAPDGDSAESKLAPGASVDPCKFFINNGYCAKGDACKYAHDRAVQQAWIAERKAKRREIAVNQYGDPHGTSVANKSMRASKFANWLRATFGVEVLNSGSGVLDVAGGRGDVSFELFTKQGIRSTLVEPRARKLNKHQHKFLKKAAKMLKTEAGASAMPELCEQIQTEFTSENWHLFKDCSVVVGMHPDQATDAIVDFALEYNKPFAVVPCCVFPDLFNHRRDRRGALVTERMALVEYLADKSGGEVEYLDIEGANQVVFRRASARAV